MNVLWLLWTILLHHLPPFLEAQNESTIYVSKESTDLLPQYIYIVHYFQLRAWWLHTFLPLVSLIDIVYLDSPTDPIFRQNKNRNFCRQKIKLNYFTQEKLNPNICDNLQLTHNANECSPERERERERGQWAVYYSSHQSFIITFSYSLA